MVSSYGLRILAPQEETMSDWGSPREREIRKRIGLSVATYAYEIADKPIMPDSMWDMCAQEIDKHMPTGHPLLDEFFLTEFSPMTGMWIHKHPELPKVKQLFERYYDVMRDYFEARAHKLKRR